MVQRWLKICQSFDTKYNAVTYNREAQEANNDPFQLFKSTAAVREARKVDAGTLAGANEDNRPSPTVFSLGSFGSPSSEERPTLMIWRISKATNSSVKPART